MSLPLTTPLSDLELDQLADFLYDEAPCDALNVSELHGFLSALVAGPEPVTRDEWLPVVWGQAGAEAPALSNKPQYANIVTLIERLYHSLVQQLSEQPADYQPIFMCGEQAETPDIDDWCYGFMIGVSLRHDAWQPLLDDEEVGGLLLPIIACGMEYAGELVAEAAPSADLRADLAQAIPSLIPALFASWQSGESAASH